MKPKPKTSEKTQTAMLSTQFMRQVISTLLAEQRQAAQLQEEIAKLQEDNNVDIAYCRKLMDLIRATPSSAAQVQIGYQLEQSSTERLRLAFKDLCGGSLPSK